MDTDLLAPPRLTVRKYAIMVACFCVVALVVDIDDGIGDRTLALPLSAFQMNADAATTGSLQSGTTSAARRDDDMRIVLTVPVDQLKSAPEFDDDD